ncbi:MAG: NAD(P)H-dependent oxidoreductase [Gammaproteobacteria bacterium]|nr:NAD(P)H-dependent oxidoreductase [Gammaproteobacteria bacterium]
MNKVLIINAHQFYKDFSEGELNKSMVNIAKELLSENGFKVRLTDIEKGYDINDEVENHLWADLIITQSPVFWFGTPWIYKKYADEIFSTDLASGTLVADDGRTRKDPSKQYGTGGKMQGKKYLLSLTWNAPKEAFDNEQQFLFEGRSVDDVFIGNTTNYKFSGAEVLPCFSCFDVRKNPDIENDISRYKQHLTNIINDRSD